MGFTEVLTIAFIILKLMGVINWNWFFVLLPEIMAVLFYIFCIICTLIGFIKWHK